LMQCDAMSMKAMSCCNMLVSAEVDECRRS
jgi:hypothetical protein